MATKKNVKKKAGPAPVKKAAVKKVAAKKTVSPKKTTRKVTPPPVVPFDHFIPEADARKMIAAGKERGLIGPILFHRAIIEEILKQSGVVHLKVYTAVNSAGQTTNVLMGGDERKKDVLIKRKKKKIRAGNRPIVNRATDDDEYGAADMAQVCDPIKQAYRNTDE